MNVDFQQLLLRLREKLPQLRERYGVGSMWVIGSRARGDHRPDSDLDLMVTFERKGISLLGLASLEMELTAYFGLKVEIVEEGAAKPRVTRELLKDAVPV
ncbi:MAG: nucleotidyltransferase family protein [Fimbriimonas sp.]